MAATSSVKNLLPGVKKFLSPSIKGQFGRFRSMTTLAVKNYNRDEDSALDVDSGARQAPVANRDDLFSEVWNPLFPPRRLSNLANVLDGVFGNPFVGVGDLRGGRKPWDVVEDKDSLRLRVDMPGLSKEEVRVHVEENSLVIKGEAQADAELDGGGRRYSSRIDVPRNVYKLDQIKAEMKNGVLKITVPKVKEEELKNVINVAIE